MAIIVKSKSSATLSRQLLGPERPAVKLLVQPGDSVTTLVQAINIAKRSIEVLIFRFDRCEIENALAHAVTRGVALHSLIAYTTRGAERDQRKLEMQMLPTGMTISR